MTLSVYDRTMSKYGGHEVFNMKEANAARGGGNNITVRDEGWSGFEFELDNDSLHTQLLKSYYGRYVSLEMQRFSYCKF